MVFIQLPVNWLLKLKSISIINLLPFSNYKFDRVNLMHLPKQLRVITVSGNRYFLRQTRRVFWSIFSFFEILCTAGVKWKQLESIVSSLSLNRLKKMKFVRKKKKPPCDRYTVVCPDSSSQALKLNNMPIVVALYPSLC